jgi:predicted branched-subunit amino acid permease
MHLSSPVWRHPEFRRGARDMAEISIGIGAWGLITGVAMAKAGLSVGLAVMMSLLVFAGSAQLAVLPLISSGAPVWVIWATAACVNLRFLILSSQWRPYLGVYPLKQRLSMSYFAADLNYVVFLQRFPNAKPQPEQVPYFWGGVAINWVAWQALSIAGILLAQDVPAHWGIGFAGTLALLGLTCAMVSDRGTWIAAAVAACAAVAAYALPLKLNIVVAIAAAVAMGLLIDHSAPQGPVTSEDKT